MSFDLTAHVAHEDSLLEGAGDVPEATVLPDPSGNAKVFDAVGLANWQPSDPKILSLFMLVKIPRYFRDSKPRNQVLDMFLAWRVGRRVGAPGRRTPTWEI
jgi:hypothetical protein